MKLCESCRTAVMIAPTATEAPRVCQQSSLQPSPYPSLPDGYPSPFPGRPTAVTIIAVLEFIAGVMSVLTGLLFVLSGVGIRIFSIVRGAADFATGWGLWTQRKWGWAGAIILAVISIVIALLSFSTVSIVMIVLEVAISGMILYCLTRPHIRAVFH